MTRYFIEEEALTTKKQTFSIEIMEILSMTVKVEADDEQQALIQTQRMYKDERVVLNSNNHVSTEFLLKGCKDNDTAPSSSNNC